MKQLVVKNGPYCGNYRISSLSLTEIFMYLIDNDDNRLRSLE